MNSVQFQGYVITDDDGIDYRYTKSIRFAEKELDRLRKETGKHLVIMERWV